MSLKIKAELFEDKQNFLFLAWGQAKIYVWGNTPTFISFSTIEDIGRSYASIQILEWILLCVSFMSIFVIGLVSLFMYEEFGCHSIA